MVAITHKIHSSRSNNNDSTEYVGEAGRVFYEQTTATGIAPILRYSDGDTPGGLALSGASITVTGSAPLNPLEGNLWYDNNDGRLYVYYDTSWVDASPDSTSGTNGVTSIVAGYNIGVSTSTGTVTVNNLFQSTSTTLDGTLTLDFTGPGVIFWKPSADASRSITLTGFTPGRSIKLWITPNNTGNTFTFTGATASQFSNGSITFVLGGGGTSQASMMIELFSTTSAIGGVWAFAYGGV